MEYIVFLFMAVLVIIALLFLVFGFQFMTEGSKTNVEVERRSLFVTQSLISSEVMGVPRYQSLSVLDDSKLTVIAGMDCGDFESAIGEGIWVNVTFYTEKPDCGLTDQDYYECMDRLQDILDRDGVECTDYTYPDCGLWTICPENKKARMVYKSVPVNIYRKMENRLVLGILTVGVPVEAGA